MIAREFYSVAAWHRAPARMLDVYFSWPRGSIRGTRNMIHDLWFHARCLKPMLRPVHIPVNFDHYKHVPAHDPIPNT